MSSVQYISISRQSIDTFMRSQKRPKRRVSKSVTALTSLLTSSDLTVSCDEFSVSLLFSPLVKDSVKLAVSEMLELSEVTMEALIIDRVQKRAGLTTLLESNEV